MFEDSLVESSGRIKTKRGWTTIVSFGVQICIVIVLVLIPLIYTEALPTKQLLTFLVAPPPPPPPPPPPAAAPVVKRAPPEIVDNVLALLPRSRKRSRRSWKTKLRRRPICPA